MRSHTYSLGDRQGKAASQGIITIPSMMLIVCVRRVAGYCPSEAVSQKQPELVTKLHQKQLS